MFSFCLEPKFELAKGPVFCPVPSMTFKAYMDNIQAKTGKTQEDFWKLATKNHFVKQGKIVAKHAELLAWLKSEIGLGHVRANFIIYYICACALMTRRSVPNRKNGPIAQDTKNRKYIFCNYFFPLTNL